MKLRGALCAAMFVIMGGCIFGEQEVPASGANNTTPEDMGVSEPDQGVGVPDDGVVEPDGGVGPGGCVTSAECGEPLRCCNSVCVEVETTGGHCLCGVTQEPTPVTLALGEAARFEVLPYIPQEELDAAYRSLVVKQTGPRAISLQSFKADGSPGPQIGRDLEDESGIKLESFKAVAIPGGLLLFVNWSKPMKGETVSLYTLLLSAENDAWVLAPGQMTKPSETMTEGLEISAMGAKLIGKSLIFATIAKQGMDSTQYLTINYTEELFNDEAEELEYTASFDGMFVKPRSEVVLNVVGTLAQGSIAATWEGSPRLTPQRANGYIELQLQNKELDVGAPEINYRPQLQPAGLDKVPHVMWPLFRAQGVEGWTYLSSIYGSNNSSLDINTPSAGALPIAEPPAQFSAAYNIDIAAEEEEVSAERKIIFGWLESQTRPNGLDLTPLAGQIKLRATVQPPGQPRATLQPERSVGEEGRYTRLLGINYTTTEQAFIGVRGKDAGRALDLFPMWRGQLICQPTEDAVVSN
jgi:hypothetical protein